MNHLLIGLFLTANLILPSRGFTVDTGCYPIWKMRVATNSLGGILTPTSPMTVTSCLVTCASDPQCVGVDIPDTSLQCFIHHDAEKFANRNMEGNATVTATQYELISRCSILSSNSTPICTKNFSVSPNTHSLGATKVPGLTTRGTCQSYCVTFKACLGYDFNNMDMSCWIYTDPVAFATKRTILNIDQYTRNINCNTNNGTNSTETGGTPTGCVPTWEDHPGQGSLGGTMIGVISDEKTCMDYCNFYQPCLAIDFNSLDNPPTCWIQTNALYSSNTYQAAYVDQQRLVTRCPVN